MVLFTPWLLIWWESMLGVAGIMSQFISHVTGKGDMQWRDVPNIFTLLDKSKHCHALIGKP